jgi:phosphoglycolate phosphatase-like HAD superfamily hydrolase
MIEAIIFDFDGVILESINIKSEAFAYIYSEYEKDIIEKIVAHHRANGGMSRYKKFQFYHKNFLNKKITQKDIKILDKKFSEFVMRKIRQVPFVEGVKNFIETHYQNYQMFISTGAPQYEVEKVAEIRNIKHFFKKIYGSPATKIEHIKSILLENNLHPSQVVFIGDGTTDKISANQTNLHFIARISTVDSALKNEQYRINDFTEIEKILEKISISDLIT